MYSKQNRVVELTTCVTNVAVRYRHATTTFKPVLTISLRETLVYAAGVIAASSVMVILPVSAASLGSLDEQLFNLKAKQNSSYIVKSQSPSDALQQVPLGFRDEFQRARAEAQKNRNKVFQFRYIQKGNIEGLTDSDQNGIGPGHGKSTAALEVAIAHKSSRSWQQVRVNALNHALGKQSFNDFSSYINQQQKKAGLPKLTEFQLRNFMDISFWRTPEKGEPDMAKETGDSEYYQLPKLTSSVRANLFNIKLKYQEQIFKEAVFSHDLTGRILYKELVGNQNLLESEAKFVSNHLNDVRFAKSANKTQALLRLGSEPYIQPPVDAKPGTLPVTFAPVVPPIAIAPSGTPPSILIPPNTGSSRILPPILISVDDPSTDSSRSPMLLPPILVPSDTSSDSAARPSPLLMLSDTPQRRPAWNRMVVLVGIPVLALLPAILNGGDDDDDNSSTSTSSPSPDSGTGTNTLALPLTEQLDGFPNTPPSSSTGSSGEGDGTSRLLTTVDSPILSPEVIDTETATIPEPSSILGLVAAGAGLLVARFKKINSKKE